VGSKTIRTSEAAPAMSRRSSARATSPVRRAMEVGEGLRHPIEDLDEQARDVLFEGRWCIEGG
jgi:hypothetical protein